MDPAGKVVVVTGGAAGMGEAMCRRFAAAGASVVVSDIDAEGTSRVAADIGALGVVADVSDESQVIRLAEETIRELGRIDVFVSNAGVLWGEPHDGVTPLHARGNPWASNEAWQRVWDVNVMPQVYATRAVLPHMVERGSGYLIQNASAAGLLTALGNAPYATSKHAVLGLTEWLSIHYGSKGIRVSCIVAEGVRTSMLRGAQGEWFAVAGAIEPDVAADCVIDGMSKEQFLILTHPSVEKYFRGKAADYDDWISKMRRLHAKTPGLTS
ncbi:MULTISPECIES: SDR family oxidoreductase [unclassified Rhodococcus (in: high G+C Gram-positive bacteria)]|jgi:NAD(P)-dependent dehydrogenase (short-subunit alcohol dehydrogenase family)|uniref:SDR family oxidoreductase n=1 Tax=unclassified Rhodococcus (in: high G+C Gram-positive bacteria) TaxID=192944 RepID=UPI000362335D|nr:SDR family oxidoreductase [Rhodococcus sp. DK17]